MSKKDAHSKWGHPHNDQMNKMSNFYEVKLTGKLPPCVGCAIIKSTAAKTTRTCSIPAAANSERLFIDTTGPFPKSRGGKKYWQCGLDDKSDKTWVHFSPSKNQMVIFVKDLVTKINGLGLKVKYLRCDNAGEHQQELQEYCNEVGIVLEYTAPNTPKQNGRVEKKIHIIWQRAMTMMSNANLTIDAQKEFWAEAVACSAFIEDLMIKAGRTAPALFLWTNTTVTKWLQHLIQFGRIGVVNKHGKQAKMTNKGFPAMMVGYAQNHGAGTYRLYNPKTKRIIMSRDVKWMDFKSKTLETEFELFEPGLKSESTKREDEFQDDSSISTQESEKSNQDKTKVSRREKETKDESQEEDSSTSSSDDSYSSVKRIKVEDVRSSSESTSSSDEKRSAKESNSSIHSSSISSKQQSTVITRRSHRTQISKPRAVRRSPRLNRRAPVSTVTIGNKKQLRPRNTNTSVTSQRTSKVTQRSRKVVTGDTTARRVTISTEQDEGEDREVNLVSGYETQTTSSSVNYIFELREDTVDRLYKCVQADKEALQQIYTLEVLADPFTPTTIKQALTCEDKELWKKSAIAEVNNFLKRNSWNFIPKSKAKEMGRKLIGVKWVFKIK